jgi:hypothetical protein
LIDGTEGDAAWKVTLRIKRYNPDIDHKPQFKDYVVEVEPTDGNFGAFTGRQLLDSNQSAGRHAPRPFLGGVMTGHVIRVGASIPAAVAQRPIALIERRLPGWPAIVRHFHSGPRALFTPRRAPPVRSSLTISLFLTTTSAR